MTMHVIYDDETQAKLSYWEKLLIERREALIKRYKHNGELYTAQAVARDPDLVQITRIIERIHQTAIPIGAVFTEE